MKKENGVVMAMMSSRVLAQQVQQVQQVQRALVLVHASMAQQVQQVQTQKKVQVLVSIFW